ncbi:two-component regulator propeller domain-containing protein [Aquimarina sp. MMG016]|uniref:type IX secretion system anionic LPS delivery protein PorZ n=1 Tax=Aquimarina sp. MMG016 TaxID=2822690 RepID=UPI001B39F428|nr:two-component regulator propeller domain-containing protein [Aquimarina sp. MMG016]
MCSQDFSNRWTGHYSYFQISDLYVSDSKIYAASENSIFVYDTESNTSKTFSTVDGLSGETISSVYHSSIYDLTAIGYENGLIEILLGNDDVKTFIDIVEKPTIPPTDKRINHFFESDNILYISTDFGIVEFNLDRIEFRDTFLIGPEGSQVRITGTTVQGNSLYATSSSNGIFSADINNSNLVDFSQWTQLALGNFNGIEVFNNQIYVWQNTTTIQLLTGNVLTNAITTTSAILDFLVSESNLSITLADRTLVYDTNLQEISTVISNTDNAFTLNTSTVLGNKIYLGTRTKGLLEVDIMNTSINNLISPDGPLLNIPFALEAFNNNLWVVYGDHSVDYNPFPLQRRGISRLKNGVWQNISRDNVLGAGALSYITINPNNEEQVFISSLNDGLLEINNNVVTNLYNTTNSDFESFVPDHPTFEFTFLYGSVFDRNGDLWIGNSRVQNGLKRFNIDTKEIFNVDLASVIPTADQDLGFSDVVLDRNGNVFTGSYLNGVIGYNISTGQLTKVSREGNLPSVSVSALAMDRNNQLWIGTFKGLRVLFNASGVFQESNPQTSQIIILDDESVPQELLFDQFITDIEVDGSNNKWVATSSSGVFYFSSDGQETLEHFTVANSPLPSNNILDISIDDSTGSVYFASEKGLLEFKGTATGPEDNLDNVVAFPNPVRPGFSGRVTIKGLTSRASVKITDIEGNLVYEEISEGGSIQWDTSAFGRHKVASGVYLILVTGEDQAETTVSKLLIVR